MKKYILFVILSCIINVSYSQNKPDFKKLDNAVVVVLIYDYKGEILGHGSGFIIDENGTIATNYHVIEDAYTLKVRIENEGYRIDYEVDKILSGNKESDVALISLKNSTKIKFPYLSLSKTLPKKGDPCWSIGTPADIQYMNTLTEGIISNIYSNGIDNWTGQMLQVSAPFSHGSSGGALINSNGEVVGITCGGGENKDEARANINWAICINELKSLSSINKKSIVDPNKIPCQIAFYTNSKYTGNVYLYVNSNYVGAFSKYFNGNYTPTCGEEGTITRYLNSGTHFYQVYYADEKKWQSGSIALKPGECQIFKIGGSSISTFIPQSQYGFPAIELGSQIWMNENLKLKTFRNGNLIPYAKNEKEWRIAIEKKQPAYCIYGYNLSNLELYGVIYNCYAVNDSRGLAPKGWHIPSKSEWISLINYLGGEGIAGGKLKSNSGWSDNSESNNESGFNSKPTGFCSNQGKFYGIQNISYWWTTLDDSPLNVWSFGTNIRFGFPDGYIKNTELGFSVRCIKD